MPTLLSNAERRAKAAENYPAIFGAVNLTSIRENVGEILKLIGRDGIFREYTLHDANHIDAVLALVDKLIPPDTADRMRTADWLIIVLSCYFHDLGMLVTKAEFDARESCEEFVSFSNQLISGDTGKDYEEALNKLTPDEREEFLYQEFVRKYHARRIYHWIQGQDAPQYGSAQVAVEAVNGLLSQLEQVVRADLAKICLSHHEEDLFDLEKYQVNRVYGDDPVAQANLHYAALILRSADILQIQKKRVPPVLYKLIDPSNPKSQEEWAKQAGVRAVKPRYVEGGAASGTIEVHASFGKESAYFGLLAYLQQFAGKELHRCYQWGQQAEQKGSVFDFPWRVIDSSQVEPLGFEGRSYAFRLDQEKILKLLTGHTLYNDYRVAIREVLQNALDAVRFRNYLNKDEPTGKIDVHWDPKTRKLTVRDTGTGMTQDTIENFLLNVGSSFYQSEAVLQKYADFSSISRFGIGVLSTFMIADEVQILTVHPDDEFARHLTLPSVVKSYLIRKVPKGDASVRAIGPHGTEVTLQVRRSAELKNVEQLVRYWLILPKCQVACQTGEDEPVSIGFADAKSVVEHFYKKEAEKSRWKSAWETRTASEPGLELAFVVSKFEFVDVWDFEQMHERGGGEQPETEDQFLSYAPGMCVEGVRVRSVPAGFSQRDSSPWAFADLTGRSAPKTNVARSDVEQTPELDEALLRVYSAIGRHIQDEFDRLVSKGSGIAEAANEADKIRSWGLERTSVSNYQQYRQAMAQLRVVAVEDADTCRATTKRELVDLLPVWTVDSKLVENIEGICGALGIDLPAERVVAALGKQMQPQLPLPRVLGYSIDPVKEWDVTKIRVYPEERSHRIDLRWEREKPGRWIPVDRSIFGRLEPSRDYSAIWITRDRDISEDCPNYDMIVWRGWCLILASSVVPELLDVLGRGEEFARWLTTLLKFGEIPLNQKPLLEQHLEMIAGRAGKDLLSRLVLPFERRFGDPSSTRRGGIAQYDDLW